MELRQLEHFVAVAEEGHFNRAAIRCHIVRSGLSASIRELERDLGTQLFLRTTREVRLTAAGQALLVEARRTLAAAASARGAVIEAGHHVRGPLSVGFSDGIRTLDVPALVANFHALYPAVTIAVVHGEPKTILDAVVSAAVDVAVTYLPARLPACLCAEVLESGPFVLACGSEHPLAGRSEVELAELRAETVITVPSWWGARTDVDEAWATAGVTPASHIEANDLETALDLVRVGAGVAIVPGLCASEASDDLIRRPVWYSDARPWRSALSCVPLACGGPTWTYGMVSAAPALLTPAAHAFLDGLRGARAASTA